jgi:hypothetical protein
MAVSHHQSQQTLTAQPGGQSLGHQVTQAAQAAMLLAGSNEELLHRLLQGVVRAWVIFV